MDVTVNYSTDVLPPSRDQMMRLQAAVGELAPAETPLRHFFAGGIYAREMTIPAGVVVVGKIHKKPHLLIVSAGDVTIITESGVKRVQAPYVIVGEPGIKRAAFAHTETVVTAFHATGETDLEKIEAEFIAPDYSALDDYMKQKVLECRGE